MLEVTVLDRTTIESTWEVRRDAETSMRESRSTSATGENRGLFTAGGDHLEEGAGFGTTEDSGGLVPGTPESSSMCKSKLTEGEQRLGCAGWVGDRDLYTVVVGGRWISAIVVV